MSRSHDTNGFQLALFWATSFASLSQRTQTVLSRVRSKLDYSKRQPR
jgi:hypothetical protein